MKILRTTPKYFDVVYVINPHMKPGTVDTALAQAQWEELGKVYEDLGIESFVIEGQPDLPDMVFSANSCTPYRSTEGRKAVILSNMNNEERRAEVPFYAQWFEKEGYEVHCLPEDLKFEGMGDVFYDRTKNFLWGGFGFRTDEEAHRKIEELSGLEVRSLRLVDPAFYHLDTCLCPLDAKSAIVLRPAFDDASWEKLEEHFENLIELSLEEAYNFAANAHCPDEKHVLLQKGSPTVEDDLREKGFEPIPVDTGEFLKSGGSVTCMRLELEVGGET